MYANSRLSKRTNKKLLTADVVWCIKIGNIIDPCCDGGYLLTVLGFLNFESICSDKSQKLQKFPKQKKDFLDFCKNHEKVITFFKCESTLEMLEKLKPAIALLDRHQKPYDVVYTNFVGTIVYEDDWQIAVSVEDGEMV